MIRLEVILGFEARQEQGATAICRITCNGKPECPQVHAHLVWTIGEGPALQEREAVKPLDDVEQGARSLARVAADSH